MTTPVPSSPTVFVMGEALIDLVIDVNKGADAAAVPGGSPANVALALSRLGVDVDLATWIGTDDFGSLITTHLEASNVRITLDSLKAAFTSTAEAHIDETGAATYIFDLEWAPIAPLLIPTSAQIAHTGSIASVIQPGSDVVLDAFRRAHHQALTTYDPNARPTLMGEASKARQIVEEFVRASDLVKVSDEDLEWLFSDATPVEVIQRWLHDLDVSVVVMTRGKDGPIAWTRGGVSAEVQPPKVTVVDTVGAGDTFMGGLIDALWRRDLRGIEGREQLANIDTATLQAILEDASEAANVVVQRRGANPPWAKELGR